MPGAVRPQVERVVGDEQMNPDQVEAVARALCREAGEDPDGGSDDHPNWKRYGMEARQHVAAFNALVSLDRSDAHWLDQGAE